MRVLKKIFLILTFLTLASCGSLKLTPKGCRTGGQWGDGTEKGNAVKELSFSEVYYVWNVDYEVRLKEFLNERKIDCAIVQKIRVEMKSIFFVKRELTVFVQK
ncbi:MAG: hypothetical protein WC635_15460 [Bacteriovorax sp.]|jgi:hypothetical protein